MCTEHYGGWSLHNQHVSGINDFLKFKIIENSLFVVLMMIFS